ncbi:2-iminobutanoate/2-iminopropanoate deaminase [Paraburkholderia caballeronis]|uniref:RidA family protein n=1 Tax=Paraburkholderia caballeronis TaxID=416943 RepID=UPI0010655892|nr:RidA family protein [Paraburkholderia caballeronis]TDV24032.1 2-iminobutanoate/2-iminopropanoate deaminase [Paraburkholderia caballeronis]
MPRSIDVPGLAHKVPIPVGARVANVLCSSAIAGKDPATGRLAEDAAGQVRVAFDNLERFLDAGGATLADVVKLTVYVKDDSVREHLNGPWLAFWPDPAARPARHVVVHDLQHGMVIQLETLAVLA